MLPPNIIRDILERERARREAPQPQLEISLPLPPPLEPRETEPAVERGIFEIDFFG
ncbi:MAG: hypothetical protein KF901_26140 [Myxococcales bacterium]|nr:hypothetical protein [Myxococcales bacterium]